MLRLSRRRSAWRRCGERADVMALRSIGIRRLLVFGVFWYVVFCNSLSLDRLGVPLTGRLLVYQPSSSSLSLQSSNTAGKPASGAGVASQSVVQLAEAGAAAGASTGASAGGVRSDSRGASGATEQKQLPKTDQQKPLVVVPTEKSPPATVPAPDSVRSRSWSLVFGSAARSGVRRKVVICSWSSSSRQLPATSASLGRRGDAATGCFPALLPRTD